MYSSTTNFLKIDLSNTVLTVKLCNVKKKNAINFEMYEHLIDILKKTATDDQVNILVITGEGDYFSSGNDFSSNLDTVDSPVNLYKTFIDALIDYPKILIAVVNGPAIGIACTMLPLFDIVYAHAGAYFLTPFSRIGLSAEGCSTYTFPKIFGKSKAMEMLYFCYQLNAKEALQHGFVSKLYTDANQEKCVWNKIYEFTKLPQHSIKITKNLVTERKKQLLHHINKIESENLELLFKNEKTVNAILNVFLSKKSKI